MSGGEFACHFVMEGAAEPVELPQVRVTPATTEASFLVHCLDALEPAAMLRAVALRVAELGRDGADGFRRRHPGRVESPEPGEGVLDLRRPELR
eukprot:gene25173-53362_t